MLKNIISIAALLLAVLGCGLSFWSKFSASKIAYVKTAVIIEKYEGMREAKSAYEKKVKNWESNIDTLKNDFIRNVSSFDRDSPKLSIEQRENRQMALTEKEKNVINYQQAIEEKARAEQEKMLQSVIGQINSFIEKFGKEKGYKIILGTTSEGSVLYGDISVDITEEVLEELNKEFRR
jgi:outer membrane protein